MTYNHILTNSYLCIICTYGDSYLQLKCNEEKSNNKKWPCICESLSCIWGSQVGEEKLYSEVYFKGKLIRKHILFHLFSLFNSAILLNLTLLWQRKIFKLRYYYFVFPDDETISCNYNVPGSFPDDETISFNYNAAGRSLHSHGCTTF